MAFHTERIEIAKGNIAAKDPGKGHFYVSMVKSVVRVGGFAFLVMGNFVMAGLLLIAAEGLGIVEEIV